MILVDANLLLYAVIPDYAQHERSRAWLEQQFNATEVGLPWPCLLAFLRISTNARIFGQPLTIEEAWGQVREWLDLPRVWIPHPTSRHAETLAGLLLPAQVSGKLVSDAHLAALAIEHDLRLCSADKDFACFSGLDWENPLS